MHMHPFRQEEVVLHLQWARQYSPFAIVYRSPPLLHPSARGDSCYIIPTSPRAVTRFPISCGSQKSRLLSAMTAKSSTSTLSPHVAGTVVVST